MRLINQFYNLSRAPQVMPDAVITLNSPTLSAYEIAFLQSFHKYREERFPVATRKSTLQSQEQRRPLLVCADGAYRRLQRLLQPQHSTSLRMIDYVIGDFDSLSLEIKEEHAKSGRWFTVPTVREASMDLLLPPSPDHYNKGPMWLQVKDQDTTDMEKCLRFLSRVFLAVPMRKHLTPQEVVTSSENDPLPSDEALRPGVVVVLGAQGGEWHHEEATLRAAAAYTTDPKWLLDIRLHTPTSTILFGNTNGKTVFTRNVEYETSTFGLVPLGDAPRLLKTEGLQWELQYDAIRSPLQEERTYLREHIFSTSNRLEDTVTITCERSSKDCALAIGIVHKERDHIPTVSATSTTSDTKDVSKKVPGVGVSVLIRKWSDALQSYQYLVIERGKAPNKGLWSFPGGSVQHGERAQQAAQRELEEETGMPLGLASYLPVATQRVIEVISGAAHFVLIQIAGEVKEEQLKAKNTKLKAADDAADLAWWTREEIEKAALIGKTVPGLVESIDAFSNHFAAATTRVGKAKL